MFGNTFVPGGGGGEKKPFLLPWGVFAAISPLTTLSDPYAAAIDKNLDPISFAVCGLVLGANDAFNYWRIYVRSVGTTVFACEVNTSLQGPLTWWLLQTTSFSGALDLNTLGIFVEVAKVGLPANMLLFGPAFWVIEK